MNFEKVVLLLPNVSNSIWSIFDDLQEVEDSLTTLLIDFIEQHGLDVIYILTIIMNLIVISYWRDFKNWKNQDLSDKMLIGSAVYGAIVFNLLILLKLIGILDL